MVICLERDADLHMAQLMPLPLTVSCFSKIQTGFTFLVPDYSGSPRKGPLMSSLPAAAVTYVLGCVYTSGTQSGISLTSRYKIGLLPRGNRGRVRNVPEDDR